MCSHEHIYVTVFAKTGQQQMFKNLLLKLHIAFAHARALLFSGIGLSNPLSKTLKLFFP